jgi:hypothetical protein
MRHAAKIATSIKELYEYTKLQLHGMEEASVEAHYIIDQQSNVNMHRLRSEKHTFEEQALRQFDENHYSQPDATLQRAIEDCHSTLYEVHGETFPDGGTLRERLETCVESTRALSRLSQHAPLSTHHIEELFTRWAAILTLLEDS